jgi:ABC-type Zn uptake system ZnuABC Zn-binding protein ZnuA
MLRRLSALATAAVLGLSLAAGAPAAEPLEVVASVPDLGDLVRQVGGDAVRVTVLVKGPQDAHFIEPRPSFIRQLHRADLFVQVGMDLEAGWAPVLLRQARNPGILPGQPGHVDASVAVVPLEVPDGALDRSQGDVHPHGNPHYLTDPLNGLRVAGLLRERLAALRPGQAAGFEARHADFARRLLEALVGAELAARHGPQLVQHAERGSFDDFLAGRAEAQALGGWLGALRPHEGVRAVQDHRMWPYFARRFGLVLIGTLEPQPGIAPTTRHLASVVQRVEREGARLVLASPYFDLRHARWLAEHTDARVVELAHQVGSRPGTDDYLATLDYNVRRLLEAL